MVNLATLFAQHADCGIAHCNPLCRSITSASWKHYIGSGLGCVNKHRQVSVLRRLYQKFTAAYGTYTIAYFVSKLVTVSFVPGNGRSVKQFT